MKYRIYPLILAFIMSITQFSAVAAEPLAKDYFGHIGSTSSGNKGPIGSYARGCIDGAVQLPETGASWQAMRLSRNRNYGHKELINFIEDLSRTAQKNGWAGLYVGDLSQPRGGPMLSGHASHQIGLDADIWMLPPKRINLTREERENISSISVVTDDYLSVNDNFTQAHVNILAAAAQDQRVARIFVTPAVKVKLCEIVGGDPNWLGKIRPWWGHNYHFHVRLSCPPGATYCVNQYPVPKGSDCENSRAFYGMHIAKTIPLPPTDPDAPKPKPVEKNLAWLPDQCRPLVQ